MSESNESQNPLDLDLRTRIAAALFNVDNGGIVAYLDVDEPDLMDTDRVIDGTINFAKLADAVIREVLTPEFLADLIVQAVQKAADDETD